MCPTPVTQVTATIIARWVVGVDIGGSSTHRFGGRRRLAAESGDFLGGVASDGTNMFVVTGNTFNTHRRLDGGRSDYPLASRALVDLSCLPTTGRLLFVSISI